MKHPVSVTTSCGRCGVGTMEARVGCTVCDYCGAYLSYPWVVAFCTLKDGEQFVFASARLSDVKVYRKNKKLAERTGPLCDVIPLAVYRKAYNSKRRFWEKELHSEFPGKPGVR